MTLLPQVVNIVPSPPLAKRHVGHQVRGKKTDDSISLIGHKELLYLASVLPWLVFLFEVKEVKDKIVFTSVYIHLLKMLSISG